MQCKRWIAHFVKYKPLMHELVVRDLKVKYRRSILGYLWSLLNPLLMMMVMYFVFSNIFRFDIPNYPLYLISGQTLFSFFSESTSIAMSSVVGNASLIKKVYIPKFIFPISRILSSFVTMSFSLVAILVVMLFLQTPITYTVLLVIFPLFFLFLFCCGIGMILAALAVPFRDITHLYGVLTTALVYATPIFYPIESVSPEIQIIIRCNPLYHYINMFRSLTIYAVVPEFSTWMSCIVSSVVAVTLGICIFNKLQRNFLQYV